MDRKTWERAGAASGIAFVALSVASAFIVTEQPPRIYDPIDKMVSYFANHRVGLLWSSYLFGLATAAFLWFLGSVRHTLWKAEGDTGRLSNVVFGAGIATAGIALGGQAMILTLAYNLSAVPTVGPGAVVTLYSIANVAYTVVFFPAAVFVAATSVVVLRHKALPSSLGIFGLPLALGMLAVGGAFRSSGAAAPGSTLNFMAYLVVLAWILATSVAMVRQIGTVEEPKTIYLDQPQRERLVMKEELHKSA